LLIARLRVHHPQLRRVVIAAVLALLAGPAVAQQQTFRNERGQITGSSSTSGNITTFRDRSGRLSGTAERMRDGSVQYRDPAPRGPYNKCLAHFSKSLLRRAC
jgi:YD repeat-containing protein